MDHRLSNIYQDGRYFKKNPTWHMEDSQYKADDVIKLIKRNGIKATTICEVGCGAGEILNQLSLKLNDNIKFFGYEISPQAFDLCSLREQKHVHFYLRDLLEEESFFDLVLALDVFEHVEDYLGFLIKLKRRGKYKVFRIPLNISVQSVLSKSRPILRAREDFGHLHYFSLETALATLHDTGYQTIDFFLTFSPISLRHLGWKRYLLKTLKKGCFHLHKRWVSRLLDGFSLMVLAK